MFYFINENTEIDMEKISVVEKRINILTGNNGLYVRVDGRDIKIDKVQEFMSQFEAFKKQEALNKQRIAV